MNAIFPLIKNELFFYRHVAAILNAHLWRERRVLYRSIQISYWGIIRRLQMRPSQWFIAEGKIKIAINLVGLTLGAGAGLRSKSHMPRGEKTLESRADFKVEHFWIWCEMTTSPTFLIKTQKRTTCISNTPPVLHYKSIYKLGFLSSR